MRKKLIDMNATHLISKTKILSGSTLKMMAVTLMLVHHTAHILLPLFPFMYTPLPGIHITPLYILQKIGKTGFPLFAFLITEGAYHTRNIKKYCLQLLIFALISEIPFNLFAGGKFFYPEKQNVYFTLFLGAMMIYTYAHVEGELKKAVLIGILGAAALFLNADYGINGVCLILLMYVTRNHPGAQALLCFPILYNSLFALSAFIPINMYNGQRGFIRSKWLKYGFYVFYPLHMIILAFLSWLLC